MRKTGEPANNQPNLPSIANKQLENNRDVYRDDSSGGESGGDRPRISGRWSRRRVCEAQAEPAVPRTGEAPAPLEQPLPPPRLEWPIPAWLANHRWVCIYYLFLYAVVGVDSAKSFDGKGGKYIVVITAERIVIGVWREKKEEI